MLTDGEIATIEGLIPQARAAVEQLEANATGFFGWLFRDDEHTRAAVARDLFDGALAQYRASQASPDDQHEEAMAIVERLHHIIDPQWVVEASATPSAVDAVTGAVRQGARAVAKAIVPSGIGQDVASAVSWVKWVAIAVLLALALFVFYKFARLFQ